jgi:hypothetical protein
MWAATDDLPRSAHPFYSRLNQLVDDHDFDRDAEGLCQHFYADEGRPGLPPVRCFRLPPIGYFERLDAERASRIGAGGTGRRTRQHATRCIA